MSQSLLSPENSPKSHKCFQLLFVVEEIFDMYLLLGLPSPFSRKSHDFCKNCYLIDQLTKIVKELTKDILSDCFGVSLREGLPAPDWKKTKFSKESKAEKIGQTWT